MTRKPPEPDRRLRRRMFDALPDTVASGATGLADLLVTGTLSAGVAAPMLGVPVRLRIEALSSRQQRGARVLDHAANQVGGLDRLAYAATADEARPELTARVIEAAMRTTHEQKIEALGRVLANGLDGRATGGQAQILASALDSIEAPHIQVLAEIRKSADRHGDVPYRGREELTLTDAELGERFPGHRLVLGAVTKVLAGYHLIEPVSDGLVVGQWGGPGRWATTELGRALLAHLDEKQA